MGVNSGPPVARTLPSKPIYQPDNFAGSLDNVNLPTTGGSMQDAIRKRVFADLAFSPAGIVPAMLGGTALILTWANNGPVWLGLSGLFGILAGIAIVASKFLLFLPQLTQKAFIEVQDQLQRERHKSLLQLHDQLKTEHDSRTTDALRDLIAVCDTFQKRVAKDDGIAVPAKSLLADKVNTLFEASLKQLSHQHQLWADAKAITGRSKKLMTDQREKSIGEIQASVEQVSQTIDECMSLASSADPSGDLSDLRRQLETTMRVAKRTDERLTEMGIGKEKT